MSAPKEELTETVGATVATYCSLVDDVMFDPSTNAVGGKVVFQKIVSKKGCLGGLLTHFVWAADPSATKEDVAEIGKIRVTFQDGSWASWPPLLLFTTQSDVSLYLEKCKAWRQKYGEYDPDKEYKKPYPVDPSKFTTPFVVDRVNGVTAKLKWNVLKLSKPVRVFFCWNGVNLEAEDVNDEVKNAKEKEES